MSAAPHPSASFPSWLAWAVVLGGLAVRLYVAPSYGWNGYEGDLIEQKQMMHRSITLGVHEVYTLNHENDPAIVGGEWQGGYFFGYPPVIVYLRSLTGRVYRYFAPEEFELWSSDLNYYQLVRSDLGRRLARSRGFTVAAKLPSILGDCVLILGLFVFVAPRAGRGVGLAVSAAYAFNPGIIVDSAHWGQHDSVWVCALALSFYWMSRARIELSWLAYTLAALSKPQASAFFFLILGLGLMRASLRRIAIGGAGALVCFALVFLPFLLHGTFVESITALVLSTYGGEPVVSANANNFWWLVTGGAGYEMSDELPLLGPLTARHIGMLVFFTANAIVLWRLRANRESAATLYLAAGAIGMTFFMFNTELHENHAMVVIPLCGLAIAGHARAWWPFVLLSVSFLMNLVLFDRFLVRALTQWAGTVPIGPLSLLGASLNVVILGLLATLFWQATRTPSAGVGGTGDPAG